MQFVFHFVQLSYYLYLIRICFIHESVSCFAATQLDSPVQIVICGLALPGNEWEREKSVWWRNNSETWILEMRCDRLTPQVPVLWKTPDCKVSLKLSLFSLRNGAEKTHSGLPPVLLTQWRRQKIILPHQMFVCEKRKKNREKCLYSTHVCGAHKIALLMRLRLKHTSQNQKKRKWTSGRW